MMLLLNRLRNSLSGARHVLVVAVAYELNKSPLFGSNCHQLCSVEKPNVGFRAAWAGLAPLRIGVKPAG